MLSVVFLKVRSIRRFPYRYPYAPLTPEKIRALDKKGGNPVVPGLRRALTDGTFDLLSSVLGYKHGEKRGRTGMRSYVEKDYEEKVQKSHDKYIKKIEGMLEAKNKEIMTV